MSKKRDIRQILVKVRGRDGAAYAVVACTDESYAITRNGEMLPSTWNTEADLEDCITAMMQHAGVGTTDSKPINPAEKSSKPD